MLAFTEYIPPALMDETALVVYDLDRPCRGLVEWDFELPDAAVPAITARDLA